MFYLIETMIDAAVELCLDRDASSVMVKKLFRGSSIMTGQVKEHISILKEISTTFAGTTVAALTHFDRKAVRGNIMDAIRIAFARSIEISQNLNP
ncbi:MAG: pyrroline-5-carboxylate reductase dimerization domain-containing protein [Desulfomicrobium sp.]